MQAGCTQQLSCVGSEHNELQEEFPEMVWRSLHHRYPPPSPLPCPSCLPLTQGHHHDGDAEALPCALGQAQEAVFQRVFHNVLFLWPYWERDTGRQGHSTSTSANSQRQGKAPLGSLPPITLLKRELGAYMGSGLPSTN